jgi:hypothetical protein
VIDNLRRYIFSLGYRINKGDWWMEPSIMFQMSDYSQEKIIDVNGKVYKNLESATIWGGFSFRSSFNATRFVSSDVTLSQRLQLFTPILGANYKRYVFSYNYSYQMGDVRMGNGGFHQITLGVDIGPVRDDRFNPKWRAFPLTSVEGTNR